MKYSYKNITGVRVVTLLNGFPDSNDSRYLDLVTLSKARIANTHSSDITVDVYLERKNMATAEFDLGGDVLFEEFFTFYFIKSLVIPAGAAIDIFDGSPCVYERKSDLKIKLANSSETADVALAYNIDKNYNTGYSAGGDRQSSAASAPTGRQY